VPGEEALGSEKEVYPGWEERRPLRVFIPVKVRGRTMRRVLALPGEIR